MRVAAYLLTVAVSFSAGLIAPKTIDAHSSTISAAQVTSGPYRDGLYLGRLAAKAGTPAHASMGRWSADADRGAFIAGYEEGYRGEQ